MTVLHALWAVLKGIWLALDGLRKVLHLILMLVLFGVLLAASQSELPYVPDSAALVLAPNGYLVEELSGDPLDRALSHATGNGHGETRLRDLVDVVDEARDDDRIQALVLDLERLEGAGLPMLQDLSQSIRWFRESGKKVYAYAESYSQRQYFLAAQADEVYLDPMGYVLLEGYGYYRTYFRGTLDKLAVDVNVFKAGSHKSAPDEWTRTGMSPEDREDAEVWVGALWETYKNDVAAARKLEPGLIQAYADEAAAGVRATGGDLAQYALARGLVDGLKTRQEFEKIVAKIAGEDEESGYAGVDWQGYLPYVRSEQAVREYGDEAIGVIVASGEILDGEHSPGIVGGDSLSKLLREAREDDDLAAVVSAHRQSGRKHHGFRGHPARSRGASRLWQADRRIDGHGRRIGRLLHRDGRRQDHRGAGDDHGVDRGFRGHPDLPAHARQDRYHERRLRHDEAVGAD